MEKQKTNRREWIKTAAIIFLVILLILTFFSNTIMNRSLPEVAAQYVESGTINAKIRGTGTISANETYDVTLSQTRKIRSVMVHVGQEVTTGDVLFTLEAMESDELKQAQDTLTQMELDYQKNLITLSNGSSTEDREVQKLRENYDEALAIFRLYSNADPTQIAIALKTTEAELKTLQREAEDIQQEYTDASSDTAFSDAQAEVTNLESEIAAIEAEIQGYEEALDPNEYPSSESIAVEIAEMERELEELEQEQEDVLEDNNALHNEFLLYTQQEPLAMQVCADNYRNLLPYIQNTPNVEEYKKSEEYAKQVCDAYNAVIDCNRAISLMEETIGNMETMRAAALQQEEIHAQITDAIYRLDEAERDLRSAERMVSDWESNLERLEEAADSAQRAAEDQQAVVENLQAASTAGEALKIAEQALEDKVFESNLGSTESLDLQNAKAAIEEQKKVVEELSANADGQEIKANISGIISAIHVTAGNTAGAETPIATITVADRGYTVQIPVTMEQARQVQIGDTAEITNFWNGDLTATLENITNDPQNMGNGKLLVFRLTGDGAEAGANLTLSIGQRSANYDALIPNSAVRTDANGSFVLVVAAKSSPLGNRFIATRADVQVLASDDTTSAVSGLANGDYVITTSTVPIEAGNQVRLVDNG